jgi:Flp pilus assembly protein TadD
MKKFLLLCLSLMLFTGMQAQDPEKDIKKAARSLGSYHLDPTNMADKLQEAIDLANTSMDHPVVKADPSAWLTYGEIFMAATNKDVTTLVLNNEAEPAHPEAPAKAFKGFKMATELADKSYQSRDALKALSDGIQNIYYMGSVLYQTADYRNAFETFMATYDAYSFLQKNNVTSPFDPAEHPKTLYYAGICAQQGEMDAEAKKAFKQLIADGHADASVYDALINMYKADDPAEAERLLLEAREKFPDDTALLYAEINHYLAKGELTSLVSKLEKALELEPENVSVLVTLGQIYDKLYQDNVSKDSAAAAENFTKAMSYYQQAMAKDAKHFDAIYSIGALWYNKAAAFSVELNELASDYTPAGNRKYEAKKAQMDEAFNKALPFFQQAETIQPTDYNTLIALKEIYARQDKFELVEEYKQKLEQLEKK